MAATKPNKNSDQIYGPLAELVRRDFGKAFEGEEYNSAQELSDKLRGHAVATWSLAGWIDNCVLNADMFTEYHNQYQGRVPGSINDILYRPFREFRCNTEAQTLLGVMSFLNHDNIPYGLFELERTSDLPPHLVAVGLNSLG